MPQEAERLAPESQTRTGTGVVCLAIGQGILAGLLIATAVAVGALWSGGDWNGWDIVLWAAWFTGATIGLLGGLAVGVGLVVSPGKSQRSKRIVAGLIGLVVAGGLGFLVASSLPGPALSWWAVVGVLSSGLVAAWRGPSIVGSYEPPARS